MPAPKNPVPRMPMVSTMFTICDRAALLGMHNLAEDEEENQREDVIEEHAPSGRAG